MTAVFMLTVHPISPSPVALLSDLVSLLQTRAVLESNQGSRTFAVSLLSVSLRQILIGQTSQSLVKQVRRWLSGLSRQSRDSHRG